MPHPDNSVFRRIVSVLTAANKAPTPAVPRHKEDRLHVVENVDADIGFLTALHFLSAGTEGVVPLGSVFPCFLPPALNDRLWPRLCEKTSSPALQKIKSMHPFQARC
ncbi:hypothetical protein AB4142_24150, partial [Variovorax sp. 2RAF20]